MLKTIKTNLTNIAVIIGLITTIGTGFFKFGQLEFSLEEAKKVKEEIQVDLSNLESLIVDLFQEVKVLKEKVDLHNHDFNHTHDNGKYEILSEKLEHLREELLIHDHAKNDMVTIMYLEKELEKIKEQLDN